MRRESGVWTCVRGKLGALTRWENGGERLCLLPHERRILLFLLRLSEELAPLRTCEELRLLLWLGSKARGRRRSLDEDTGR